MYLGVRCRESSFFLSNKNCAKLWGICTYVSRRTERTLRSLEYNLNNPVFYADDLGLIAPCAIALQELNI